MPAESELENKCRKEAERRGYKLWKWVSPGNAGVPDRILLRPGRVTFIEMKAGDGKLRKLQDYRVKQLCALDQDVATVDTYKQFMELLDS